MTPKNSLGHNVRRDRSAPAGETACIRARPGGRLGLVVLIAAVWFSVLGCRGGGRIYVGHPQVHTRERLVRERFAEVQWLRKQLKTADKITTTFQGYRDFREFVGFYNELRLGIDPAQKRLYSIELENQRKMKEIEGLRLERVRREEAQKLVDSVAPKDSDVSKGVKARTLDVVVAPFGRARDELPELPDPAQFVKTEAKAGLLDLLHDKMAYRGAVNAEIRRTQLDDAHDQKGASLYELTLDLTVVPGKKSRRFAQVTLELVPPGGESQEGRVNGLHGIFVKWQHSLQAAITSEIAGLQHRFVTSRLTQTDQEMLEWFFRSEMAALLLDLEVRLERANEALKLGTKDKDTGTDTGKDTGKDTDREKKEQKEKEEKARREFDRMVVDHRLFFLIGPTTDKMQEDSWKVKPLTFLPKRTEKTAEEKKKAAGEKKKTEEEEGRVASLAKAVTDLRNFRHRARKLNQKALLEAIEPGQASKGKTPTGAMRRVITEGIAWAVWSKYEYQLARIVYVSPPEFANGLVTEGLKVEAIPAVYSVRDGDKIKKEDKRKKSKWYVINRRGTFVRGARGCDTGFVTFARRLFKVENNPHALAVNPKEYAQNISDVAARETVLNLVGTLRAVLGMAGMDIENTTQYLRRRQRVVHAIMRQPLVVGFGQGQREFGWVLGPKFAIKEDEPDFTHTPARHDCSAAIVVPAWAYSIEVRGRYDWVGDDGRLRGGGSLWDGKEITLDLAMPDDAMAHVTRALLGHASVEAFSSFANRPRPSIDLPREDEAGEHVLRAGEAQKLLILGQQLWRGPQVFVGDQKATRVEVLSNMSGLLAHFDEGGLYYPGTKPGSKTAEAAKGVDVDLHVITTFGRARRRKAVRILPPPSAARVDRTAKLETRYVVGQGKEMTFAFKRPDVYGGLILRTCPREGEQTFKDVAGKGKWDKENARVRFDYTRPLESTQIMLADLILLPRSDSALGGTSVLKGGPAPFVHFMTRAERCLKLNDGAVTLDAQGKMSSSIKLFFTEADRKYLVVAYPGFAKAVEESGADRSGTGLHLVFFTNDEHRKRAKIELPLRLDPNGGLTCDFIVDSEWLKKKRKELVRLIDVERLVEVLYRRADTGREETIPVVKGANKGTVTFTKPPPAKK